MLRIAHALVYAEPLPNNSHAPTYQWVLVSKDSCQTHAAWLQGQADAAQGLISWQKANKMARCKPRGRMVRLCCAACAWLAQLLQC